MWPFDEDEELDANVADFDGVSQSIFEQAESEEAGLLALQDAYNSYQFQDPAGALSIFQSRSDEVRKKFGDTKPFDIETTLSLAPRNFDEFTSDLPDPDENRVDVINRWEQENLAALSNATDLSQIQLRPQLERSIKQIATLQRREVYGSDNYLVTDQALRMAQGAVGPIASLVGADSVNDYFTENTDPDGASVFGYVVGGDDSYWSAISSGLGSAAGAVGAGVVSGGWGTVGYLGASGAGAVRERVEDALENEASTGEAIAAGTIEAASQVGQTFVGSKVFGGAVNKILGKSSSALGERVFPKLLKSGFAEGTAEGAGQVVSNVAQNVGRGEELDQDLLSGAGQSFVAGFVGGAAATGAGEVFGKDPGNYDLLIEFGTDKSDKLKQFQDAFNSNKGEDIQLKNGETVTLVTALKTFEGKEEPEIEIYALDKDGNKVGELGATTVEDEELGRFNPGVYVEENWRRQGVATAMYDLAQKKGALIPGRNATGQIRTVEGEAFRNAYPDPDPLLETDGTPPFKQEAIPGKAVSTELLEPGTPVSTLSDGSKILQSDGKFHLEREGKILQAYDSVKYVTPEVAEKLRQTMVDGNPDGTAITLTTDGENLLVESEFIDKDLNLSPQKTGKIRTVIPTSETEQGAVPVFVSKTRTTDDVRQNPSFIAPGTVESTIGAAKAGFGNQYASPYMKRMIEKYGPDLSEELGLTTESFEENADGTITSVQTPLQTKFRTTHAETATDAVSFLNEKGIIGALDYFNTNNKFNEIDVGAANIAVSKLEQLYSKLQKDFSEDQSPKTLNKLAKAGDLLNQAVIAKDKVGTVFGRGLGSLTNVADSIHNARAKGEFRVSQLENELTKKAYQDYQEKTGEEVNILGWTQEAQQAEKDVNRLAPKEGEAPKPGYDEAKTKYDTAVNKINEVEKIRQEKLSELTPEKKTNLIDMYELLGSLDGELKLSYAEKVFDEEAKLGIKDTDSDRFEQLFNFFRSNLLSGPSTQLRNLVGNTSKVLSDVIGLIGSGQFKEAGVFMDAWLGSSKLGLKEAKEIIKGNRSGRFKFDQKATDKKGNLKDINKVAPLTNPFTAIQNGMYRLLTAQDAVFFRNANSGMAYLAEYVANKHVKDPAQRKQYIEKALGYDQEANIRKQVEKESQMLREAGIGVTQDQVDLDVAYRMEKLRSEKTKQIADKFGDRSVFINDPSGIMGAFYDAVEGMSDKISVPIGGTTVKPLKFLMPFTRVAANVTSHIMEFTPVGILKGAVNKPGSPGNALNHQLSEIDAKMVLGRGLVGTSFMAGFFAFAEAFKDEEDPYIAFYGYPPKGKWKEWQAKGIDAFSMKIGENIVPLQGTSLAIIPAIIGGGMEAIKAGAPTESVVKAASMASIGAVSTMSFLKPAGELFDYLMASKDTVNLEAGKPPSGAAEKRSSNYWLSQADTLASGFIPASGFLNNLGRWTNESPVESYNNLAAKVFGEMPFSKMVGITDKRPQLNIFGEPITKSLVQRMSAGLAPHTIKTDPVLLWMQETGFEIPDQGPIVSLTRKNEKELFSEVQAARTGYSGILDEEQSRRVLQLSGPRIKEFLESIRKDPNFQVKGERAQKFINERVNEIRAESRLLVLSN